MKDCQGAVIVGMERTHALIGYDRPGSERQQESTHRRLATVWGHLEAGMAYQIGLPLLILREESLHIEGVLDPYVSGLRVFSFRLDEVVGQIPADSLEVYIKLRPDQAEDARAIEDGLQVGLRQLKSLTQRLSRDDRMEFATYEARLIGLLQDRKLFGPNETVRSETSRVISSSTALHLSVLTGRLPIFAYHDARMSTCLNTVSTSSAGAATTRSAASRTGLTSGCRGGKGLQWRAWSRVVWATAAHLECEQSLDTPIQ
jgi:hypothetical protein